MPFLYEKQIFVPLSRIFAAKFAHNVTENNLTGSDKMLSATKKTEVTKMKNQTIMCDVCACKHHNGKDCSCKLSKITVTPCKDCETAHYCKNYEEK